MLWAHLVLLRRPGLRPELPELPDLPGLPELALRQVLQQQAQPGQQLQRLVALVLPPQVLLLRVLFLGQQRLLVAWLLLLV